MRKLNKKGFIAEVLVDFYSYFIFILIALIFLFLALGLEGCEPKEEEKLRQEFLETQLDVILMNYH